MKHPVLPLVRQNEIEPLKSWEGISTPSDLAGYMARVLSVDPNQLLQFEEIVYSDVQPSNSNENKIWIKTDNPVGIGFPSGGSYKMIYEYPANIPFLWVVSTAIPSYIRKLTDAELVSFSLTDPTAQDANWVIMSR